MVKTNRPSAARSYLPRSPAAAQRRSSRLEGSVEFGWLFFKYTPGHNLKWCF